ncbi:MAG: PLP-dependent aminotransferase family protein [Solirubrobacterales bacterium]
MSDIERGGPQSVTGQIVDAFAAAIESGELGAGEKLPPTRELAEIAGVNHLTAARAYRRLADMGLVAGRVGSGTYVRHGAQAPPRGREGANADADLAWQAYALPEQRSTYGDRVLAEMMRSAERGERLSLSVGYPSPKLLPVAEMQRFTTAAFEEEGPRTMQYENSQGAPELRDELSALMRRRGSGEGPGDIVVTAGALQALTLATRATLGPGDIAACESPSFFGGIEAIRATGADTVAVPTDEDGLDTDALEQLLRRHEVRLVLVQPRLHNPTGRDLEPERRAHLIELARRHGFFVVEDSVYADLRIDGDPIPSLRSEAPEHVIYVDSLSKTMGGGLRLGWVAASGPVLDRILREKRGDDIHCVTLTQLAIARFLAAGAYEEHLDRAVPFHADRREVLLEAIDRELGTIASFMRPLGGGHVWVTLDEPLDERDLYEAATRNGVDFLPGGGMTPTRPLQTHMRLSYCYLDPEELREAARRLAVAVREARRAMQPTRAAMPLT